MVTDDPFVTFAPAGGPPRVVAPPEGGVLELPASASAPLALAVPWEDVLVVAGLPGAGKTTLLRAAARPGDVVLDPQRLADALHAALPAVPYSLVRPIVHATHRALVLRALLRGAPGLIIHEPGARPRWRRRLVTIARRRGHAVHLLVVQAHPTEAAIGRTARARTLPARRAARYEHEWAALCAQLATGWAGSRLAEEGFAGCTLLPRSSIGAVVSLHAPRRVTGS